MESEQGSKSSHGNTLSGSTSKGPQTNALNAHTKPERHRDEHMPIANVTRIMRRVLPPEMKISDEAKQAVAECVSAYITLITREANNHRHFHARQTLAAEDLLSAMDCLGYNHYVEPLFLYLHRYRQVATLPGQPSFRRRTTSPGQASFRRRTTIENRRAPPPLAVQSGILARAGNDDDLLGAHISAMDGATAGKGYLFPS